MYKPLVISRSYLWDRSTTGQIQRVFWEYLCERGIEPTIICSDRDTHTVPIDSIKCKLIPTRDSKWIRFIVKTIGNSIAPDLLLSPDDAWYTWGKVSAIKRAIQEADSGRYDYIQSANHPVTSHLIALKAKQKTGLPWIAYIYDPWANNPFRNFKSISCYNRDLRWESSVAENADAILHISQPVFNDWVKRYGEGIRKKMFMLPTVFDVKKADARSGVSKRDTSKFVISHIGALYEIRNSVDFLLALHLLLEEHPELKKRVVLNYVGSVTDEDRKYVSKLKLECVTNFVGFISEEDCKQYYESSDLFLSIDAKSSQNIFFPSKIMKYFYYGKPILGLTPKNSALQSELSKSNNFYFSNEDYHGIAKFLYYAITNPDFSDGIDKEYWRNFTMERICPRYIDIVTQVFQKK